jgi:hypothetical protein
LLFWPPATVPTGCAISIGPGVDSRWHRASYTSPGNDSWIFLVVEFGGKPSDFH